MGVVRNESVLTLRIVAPIQPSLCPNEIEQMASVDEALAIAAKEFRVFPVSGVTQAGSCNSGKPTCPHGPKPGKRPAIRGWPTLSTTDPVPIRRCRILPHAVELACQQDVAMGGS